MEKRAVVTHSMVLSVKQPSRKVNFSKNSFKEVSCVIIICLHKINFQSTPCWGRVLVNHPWVIILTIFSYHWSSFPSKKRTVACLQGVLWRLKNPCSDLRLIQSIYRKKEDDLSARFFSNLSFAHVSNEFKDIFKEILTASLHGLWIPNSYSSWT